MSKRPQRPKFLWDNAYLEKLAIEMGDECIFLCLSPVSFRMLTDMSAMLLWGTRYEDGEVSELGITAHRELNVPCILDGLFDRLDELELLNNDVLQGMFEDLGRRMTELEQMDINVNQTVNTGGCGCSDNATTTTTTTGGGFIDPTATGIIPPYLSDPVSFSDHVKCRSANYLALKVASTTRTLGQIGDAGGGVVAILGIIGYALTWLSPIAGDEVIATGILLRWVYGAIVLGESLDGVFEYFSDLANAMDAKVSELVCLLYNYNTSSELGASLSGWIENMVDDLRIQAGMSDASASMLSSFLSNVFGSSVINYFVENVGKIVPADFTPMYDCTCGAQGDTCPTKNIVLAGYGTFPAVLDGIEMWTSQLDMQTGYYEIKFELADNWCVDIEYMDTNQQPTTAVEPLHETCSGGVMVQSDGSCIRRYFARSLSPFVTAVDFKQLANECACQEQAGIRLHMDHGSPVGFSLSDELVTNTVYEVIGTSGGGSASKLRFFPKSLAGVKARFTIVIDEISNINLFDDAATNMQASFWLEQGAFSSFFWGYDFIPEIGSTRSELSYVESRQKAGYPLTVKFHIISYGFDNPSWQP